MLNEILESIVIFIIGLVFIFAGIFKWKYPTIFWFWRNTEYGEALNTIIMLICGIVFIYISITHLYLSVTQGQGLLA